MKTIKEYEAMNIAEQESFIAHASADLVQKLYYANNGNLLELFIKNMVMLVDRARVCLECVGVLERECNVYEKIYLLLQCMSKSGINEEFVSGLKGITEYAQNILAQAKGGSMPIEAERKRVMGNLRAVLDKNNTAMTNDNSAEAPAVAVSKTAIAV